MSLRFALVISKFNEDITSGLREGALGYLREKGIEVAPTDLIEAPGAFETPLLAQALARTGKYAGVICLGCVIKGDTAHFEFISLGTTIGLMQAMLATSIPIAFGILTTYTDAQAENRSRAGAENKGREAAAACYESATTLRRISELSRS